MKWKPGFKSRTASVVLAVGLAAGIMAVPAYADSMDTDGYVTAAARRAAMPAPEILGLTGVEESTTWLDNDDLPTSYLNWETPKYYIFATSQYNIAPNPYMYNLINDYNGTSKSIILTGQVGSPNTALRPYADTTNDYNKLIWDMLPDIIIGTQGNVNYDTDEYAGAAAAANGVSNYHPVGIAYNMNTYNVLVDTMYTIGEAADQVAENTGKKLRYGSATDIAINYESYIEGAQGYILSQLEADGANKKVVALVTDYDKDAGTYTLMTSNVQDGTASSNRYLETVEAVSTELSTVTGSTTVTAEQLAQADLIMFGSQRGGASESDMLASMSNELQQKCYYTTSSNIGSLYGVTMNSVENAQNIGRILGCLYPEYIDQDDWVCYYFDNFFHLKDAVALGTVIDNAMDGVVNWDATGNRTEWKVEDTSTYNKESIDKMIQAGLAYIQSAKAEGSPVTIPATVTTTEHIAAQANEIANNESVSIATIADQVFTGSAVEPDIEITFNGAKLVKGVEYDVTYENNIAAGTATATITGKGAFTGTAQVTFNITAENPFKDVSSTDWYCPAVSAMNALKVISGYTDASGALTGEFGPMDGLTRAQFVTILWRYACPDDYANYKNDAQNTTGLSDCESNTYYTAAANWAVEKGIMTGVKHDDGTATFNGGENVSFETMIVMLARYMNGGEVTDQDTSALDKFSDAGSIDTWAQQGMAYGLAKGLYSGNAGSDTVEPLATVYRARAAQVMYNGIVAAVI